MSNDSRSELWRAARSYVDKGLSIIPIRENTSNGFYSEWSWSEAWISDVEAVDSWWSEHPNDNIAILTGSRSRNLIVIDLDVKEGKDGINVYYEWVKKHGKMPPTFVEKSPHNGYHIYFYLTKEDAEKHHIKSVSDIYGKKSGVDTRGEGGIIIAQPSKTPDGIYQTSTDKLIAYADEKVLDFILNAPDYDKKSKMKEKRPIGLDAEIETIPAGSRNEELFRSACRMRNIGLASDSILDGIWTENNVKCQPPLSRNEVMTLVSSALSYPQSDVKSIEELEPVVQLTDDEIETLKNSRQSESEIFVYDNEYFSNEYKELPRLVRLSEIEPKEVEWIVPGYIPKGAITLFASDGGVGKGFTWVNVLASLSSGEKVFFEKEKVNRKCMRVAYFSTEDSTAHVIRPRIDKTEKVVISNILTFDMSSEDIKRVQFDSKDLEQIIKREKLDLILYDPVQSFIPENVNMSQRNHMRRLLAPLLQLGEKYGTTFVLVCHTNKRQNAYGRERLADSADLWDIARSVIMLGSLPDGTKYLSHEKSNYGPLEQTVLFDIIDKVPSVIEYTDDRDRDFMLLKNQFRNEKLNDKKQTSMDLYKELIVSALESSATRSIPSELLEEQIVKGDGVSVGNFKKAKALLRKEGRIKSDKRKENGRNLWYTTLIDEDVDF